MRGCLRACVGQEVFRSDKTDNVAFSKVIGKCYVMSVKEYFKNKPEVTLPVTASRINMYEYTCHRLACFQVQCTPIEVHVHC